jgi:hypothetical protein
MFLEAKTVAHLFWKLLNLRMLTAAIINCSAVVDPSAIPVTVSNALCKYTAIFNQKIFCSLMSPFPF